nr:hypothetical protein [uncultured Pseudoxanthomonas sp.]
MSTPSTNFFSLAVMPGRHRKAAATAAVHDDRARRICRTDIGLKKNIGKTRFFFFAALHGRQRRHDGARTRTLPTRAPTA